MTADRSVTDVVAFVLMFSMIVLSVGLVSTTGMDTITDVRDREQLDSAERGMETLANTVADVTRRGATLRRIRLAPHEGHIGFNETTLRINVTSEPFDRTWQVGALEHRVKRGSGETSVYFEAGGVFRDDGGTPRFTPPWRCSADADVATITVVNLTTDEGIQVGAGSSDLLPPDVEAIVTDPGVSSAGTSVDLRARRTNTSVAFTSESLAGDLTVDVSGTSNPDQWDFYLESEDGWQFDASEQRWVCGAPDSVLVRVVTVELTR